MNILVLTPWFPNYPHDQHGNFVLDSIESLCAIGHRVHVLVTRPFGRSSCATIRPEMRKRGFSLNCIPYFSIPRNYLRFVSNQLYLRGCTETLRKIIVERDIDVIHAHTEMAGYLACRVTEEAQVPVVTTLHGINTCHRYLNGIGQKTFLSQVFSHPKRLVVVGAPLLKFIQNYVNSSSHVRVVENGFREQGALPFRMRKAFASPNKVNIVSVSNLVKGKGIEVNLAALGQPEIQGLSNWHYHIIGDGPLRSKLELHARKFNLAEKVTFYGQCSHDIVYQILSTCDVFSLPSAPEAFGIAYLEAMACGLLAIGVEGQGPSSFIENGRTGLLIREGDVEGLTFRFSSILKNPVSYIPLARAGHEHVWQHYTWQKHAKTMTTVFQEALMH